MITYWDKLIMIVCTGMIFGLAAAGDWSPWNVGLCAAAVTNLLYSLVRYGK